MHHRIAWVRESWFSNAGRLLYVGIGKAAPSIQSLKTQLYERHYAYGFATREFTLTFLMA